MIKLTVTAAPTLLFAQWQCNASPSSGKKDLRSLHSNDKFFLVIQSCEYREQPCTISGWHVGSRPNQYDFISRFAPASLGG